MVEDIKCRQGPWREESRDAATVMNIWEASSGRNTVRGGGEERIYDGALQRRVSLRLMQGCWRHPEKYDKSSLQQLFGCSSLLRFLFSWFAILLKFNKAHVNQQQVSGSSSLTSWGDQVEVRSTHSSVPHHHFCPSPTLPALLSSWTRFSSLCCETVSSDTVAPPLLLGGRECSCCLERQTCFLCAVKHVWFFCFYQGKWKMYWCKTKTKPNFARQLDLLRLQV